MHIMCIAMNWIFPGFFLLIHSDDVLASYAAALQTKSIDFTLNVMIMIDWQEILAFPVYSLFWFYSNELIIVS